MSVLRDKIMSSSGNAREARLRRRIASRLSGDSASAYLEFAMSFPLLLGLSLFIVEMCMFWDAAVMANHAAFAISRIAKVHYNQSAVTSDDNPYPQVGLAGKNYDADKVVLAMFMMTSTYSWFGQKSEINMDFYDYFKISGPLFSFSCGDDPSIFQKILLALIKAIANPIEEKMRDFINNEIGKLLDLIFGSSYKDQMNARFSMAMQRALMDGTVKTDIVPMAGPVKFPSDDADSDCCEDPEAAKVSISYPLFKGGWLYTFFMFWKADNDKDVDAVRVTSRWSVFVEPDRYLKGYFANDDGTSDLDPDEMRREAEKRAKKIIDDASTIIDDWEKAVIAREAVEAKYGGRDKAAGKQDYKDACVTEANLWAQIVQKCNDYMKLLNIDPHKGMGMCGDKSDDPGRCTVNPTAFTQCARAENAKLSYCDKISRRIVKISKDHGLFVPGPFPHYVDYGTAYPGHDHNHVYYTWKACWAVPPWCKEWHDCPRQYFCDQP